MLAVNMRDVFSSLLFSVLWTSVFSRGSEKEKRRTPVEVDRK